MAVWAVLFGVNFEFWFRFRPFNPPEPIPLGCMNGHEMPGTRIPGMTTDKTNTDNSLAARVSCPLAESFLFWNLACRLYETVD